MGKDSSSGAHSEMRDLIVSWLSDDLFLKAFYNGGFALLHELTLPIVSSFSQVAFVRNGNVLYQSF